MRVGLHGKVRKVWAPKGVKVRQRVEMGFEWRHLALTADMNGRLYWKWLTDVKKESIAAMVNDCKEEGIRAMVWDRAPGHRAEEVQKQGMKLVFLPPYSPELNPVERIFEEIRRVVEGKVYGEIEKKVEAVERELRKLSSSPERVRSLVHWGWIRESLRQVSVQYALPP